MLFFGVCFFLYFIKLSAGKGVEGKLSFIQLRLKGRVALTA